MKIFYSWQSDLPNKYNRGFIQKCLSKAITNLNKRIELQIRLDKDTQDVEGSPDIANTILKKICESDIFVSDISIINLFEDNTSRRVCNPNVLIELGYAAAKLGWENVIMVFNLDYGRFIDLPFDIRHRRPLCYSLSEESWEDKKQQELTLVKVFESIITQKLVNYKRYPNHIVSKIYPFFYEKINMPFHHLDHLILDTINDLNINLELESIYPLNSKLMREIISLINKKLEPQGWDGSHDSSYVDFETMHTKEFIVRYVEKVKLWLNEILKYQNDLTESIINSIRVILINFDTDKFYSKNIKLYTKKETGNSFTIEYMHLLFHPLYEYMLNISNLKKEFVETYKNHRMEYLYMKNNIEK